MTNSEVVTQNTNFPPKFEAMKAETVPERNLDRYENSGWMAQEKLDGTRIVVIKRPGNLWMMSRSWKNDFVAGYPEIAAELARIPDNSVLDGELVFYRKTDGKPEFVTALATPEAKTLYNIRLMLFDVTEYAGENLLNTPQKKRTEGVGQICAAFNWEHVKQIPTVTSGFNAFYKKVTENGGEGIMMKNGSALYREGARSRDWMKVKKIETDDCVVLGLCKGNEKYSHQFGALVVGQIVNGKMQVVARVSGMTDALRTEFNEKIRAMPADNSLGDAFWKGAVGKDVFHKIAPGRMVIEAEFMERFPSGVMRHPRFLRVRDDKPWTECTYQARSE
jgi:bifunctional non-homologous end joining protein LigD